MFQLRYQPLCVMSPRRRRAAIVASVLGLMVCSTSGCVQVSAEVEQIRRTVQPIELVFDGAGDAAGEEQRETRVFEAIVDSDVLRYVSNAELTDLHLLPAGGASDLAFLRRVRVRLLATDSAPDVVVADFDRDRDQAAEADGAVRLSIYDDFDHTDYVRARVPFELTVDVDAPAESWALGVDVAFDATLSYELRL